MWSSGKSAGLMISRLSSVSKTPKIPKLSPLADNAIKAGGIRGLGSLVYICGSSPAVANLLVSWAQTLGYFTAVPHALCSWELVGYKSLR